MSALRLPRFDVMNSGPGLAHAGQRLVAYTQRAHVTLNCGAWSLLMAQAEVQVEGDWAADQSGWYGSVALRLPLPAPCLSDADEICMAAGNDPHLRVMLVRAARDAASQRAGKLLRNVAAELQVSRSGDTLLVVAELSSQSTKHRILPGPIAAGRGSL